MNSFKNDGSFFSSLGESNEARGSLLKTPPHRTTRKTLLEHCRSSRQSVLSHVRSTRAFHTRVLREFPLHAAGGEPGALRAGR